MEHLSPASYMEKYVMDGISDVVRFTIGKNVVLDIEKAGTGDANDGANGREGGSRCMRSQLLSDYKWENKASYRGRILAVRDDLLAYRLFNDSTGEAVRVLNRVTKARHLIKDFRYPIVDLQWAVHAPFLAVLDTNASVYVYHVVESCNSLGKYLNIMREEQAQSQSSDGSGVGKALPKIAWCPYVAGDDSVTEEGDDSTHLLAVVQGSSVSIFSLSLIKAQFSPRLEVKLEQAVEVPGGVLQHDLNDSDITAVKLSPDGTAMAISTADGFVNFYIVDTDRVRFANRIRPMPNHCVDEMLFLDNLKTSHYQDQFWKYVVVSGDNGRRLAIYDCDNWQCLGKLRFESPSQVGHLEMSVDPTARFLFVVDYDASNLYCLGLGNVSTVPYFASCTQISFSNNPLIALVPYDLVDVNDHAERLSFDDENEGDSASIQASFAAISHRSVLELTVDLEQPEAGGIANLSSSRLDHGHRHDGSKKPSESDRERSDQPPSAGSYQASPPQRRNSEEGENDNGSCASYAAQQPLSAANATTQPLSEKLLNAVAGSKELAERVDTLTGEIVKLRQENHALRSEQNDNLSNALEKIANELKYRDASLQDRLEHSMRAINRESRDTLLQTLDAALGRNTRGLQAAAEQTQQRTLDTIRQTLGQALVPAIEGICGQIFHQMNENFRDGLNEFLEQLSAQNALHEQQRQQQSNSLYSLDRATPASMFNDHARGTLLQLIEANQIPQAFELALSHPSLLSIACNRIDPDDLFSNASSPPMGMNTLLALLQQLGQKLDAETELKLRYIESSLLYMSNINPAASRSNERFRITLEQLSNTFNALMNVDSYAGHKRQMRLINQLIVNLLR